jgi:hypothetical protein
MSDKTKEDLSRRSDDLRLEIDGPGVHPETLDPLATLELGAAYLKLLKKIAEEARVDLEFKGLTVQDKCAALQFTPDNPARAEAVAVEAFELLEGGRLTPHVLESVLSGFRSAVNNLPSQQSVTVLVRSRKLPVRPAPVAKPEKRVSSTKLRAVVLQVGGKNPTVRFVSKSEGERPFTVSADKEQARELGALLFELVDAEVQLERNPDGVIAKGRLLKFTPVSAEKNLQAWTDWYKAAASEWDDVEDIEEELGRNDEEESRGVDA